MRGRTPAWRRYLTFWGDDVASDVAREFEFHVREREEELIAQGMPPAQARIEAARGFGDIAHVKHTCTTLAEDRKRTMKRQEVLGVLWQDATFAVRQMRAQKTLTAAALLTLAVAIGATTSLFSVVHAVLLRPLPYANAERVVSMWETVGDFPRGRVSVGHFHDWSEQAQTLEATAAVNPRSYNLTEDGAPERVTAAAVTPGYFRVFAMPPAAGRYFLDDDVNTAVVVLSHELWQGRYAGAQDIVGRVIRLSGEPHRVVGVTPRGYRLLDDAARLWTLQSFDAEDRHDYGSHGLLMYGKLRAGVDLAQAQAEIARITEGIRARAPDNMQQRASNVERYGDYLIAGYRTQLLVLLGAVGFVLLIACSNVASLLLARATARHKELAIRAALGGGRARLVRQLLTESLVLAVIGGALGVVLAGAGVRALIAVAPLNVPRLHEAGLDGAVLGFALVSTLLCGIVFGLAPALRAARADLQSVLREGGKTSRSGARDRLRGVLVVGEVAVALVLVVGAALFLRSAQAMGRVPLGFDVEGVTMARMNLPAERYADRTAVNGAFTRMIEEVRAEPGVSGVALSSRPPMTGMSVDIGLEVAGRAEPPQVGAHLRMVSADYFDVLGVSVTRGRGFTSSDFAAGAAPVVVMNETLARAVFGDEDPIGQRVSGWASSDVPEWREVIGVVADGRTFGQDRDAQPEIHLPFTQAPAGALDLSRGMAILVRAEGTAGVAASAVRRAVGRVDPLLPLYDVQRLDAVLAQHTATRRFAMLLLSLLGASGLVLAAIGIYGVIGFFVTQRTQEFGIRLALGAHKGDVVRMVLSQGGRLALFGVVAGGIAAAILTRVLSSMLFGVTPLDPVAYAAGAAVLGGTALLAALVPALRAAAVQPGVTLRG